MIGLYYLKKQKHKPRTASHRGCLDGSWAPHPSLSPSPTEYSCHTPRAHLRHTCRPTAPGWPRPHPEPQLAQGPVLATRPCPGGHLPRQGEPSQHRPRLLPDKQAQLHRMGSDCAEDGGDLHELAVPFPQNLGNSGGTRGRRGCGNTDRRRKLKGHCADAPAVCATQAEKWGCTASQGNKDLNAGLKAPF